MEPLLDNHSSQQDYNAEIEVATSLQNWLGIIKMTTSHKPQHIEDLQGSSNLHYSSLQIFKNPKGTPISPSNYIYSTQKKKATELSMLLHP